MLLESPLTPRKMLSAAAAKKFYALPDETRMVMAICAAGFAARSIVAVQLDVYMVCSKRAVGYAVGCAVGLHQGCIRLFRSMRGGVAVNVIWIFSNVLLGTCEELRNQI